LTAKPFEPARPHLTALGILLLGVAILSLPMLTGQFLAGPWSDQFATGYAFRAWLAEQWRATGHVPLWNPEIFGGLPFVAAQHGDIFYPTAWLRLALPTATAMNLGFLVHYVLAGFFTYLLLRRLTVSWTGGVVGGMAYQLTGVVGTLVSPGHDGKLYVSALLPLALLALVLAIRERRFEGYALLALSVGLSLLSPHYQMVYYLLIVAGVFALYLTFGEQEERTTREKVQALSLAAAAVVVGFGIAMIQVLPFLHYLPYSPRAEGYGGFAASASYGIPWEHVPEFLLARFAGDREVYWGSNFIKLHSEYLGLPVVALAVLGALGPRRRLAYWLGGVGLLFLLVSLSDSTPLYRLWWSVMPFVKQTRAPGMAFYVVGFVVAILAAFGAERVRRRVRQSAGASGGERRAGCRHARGGGPGCDPLGRVPERGIPDGDGGTGHRLCPR
jgi:MFS family permease